MQQIIFFLKSNFFFCICFLLCIFFSSAEGMENLAGGSLCYGQWITNIEEKDERQQCESYYEELEKNKELFKSIKNENKNLLIVNDFKDDNNGKMHVIISGMFPFYRQPQLRFNELIDYLMPQKSSKIKSLNFVVCKLNQIQSLNQYLKRLLYEKTENTKTLESIEENIYQKSSSIKSIIRDLDDIENKEELQQALDRKENLSEYLNNIQNIMCGYYKNYIDSLCEYFTDLQGYFEVDTLTGEGKFAKKAKEKLIGIAKEIGNGKKNNSNFFTFIVGKMQSSDLQDDAHKLVHTEDILFYCIKKSIIKLRDRGIRFFSQYDMCETCEEIFMKYAKALSGTFIVLSQREFSNSRKRNNVDAACLLKKYAIPFK